MFVYVRVVANRLFTDCIYTIVVHYNALSAVLLTSYVWVSFSIIVQCTIQHVHSWIHSGYTGLSLFGTIFWRIAPAICVVWFVVLSVCCSGVSTLSTSSLSPEGTFLYYSPFTLLFPVTLCDNTNMSAITFVIAV